MNVNGGKIKMISATTRLLLGFGCVFSCKYVILNDSTLWSRLFDISLSGRSSWISELANEMLAACWRRARNPWKHFLTSPWKVCCFPGDFSYRWVTDVKIKLARLNWNLGRCVVKRTKVVLCAHWQENSIQFFRKTKSYQLSNLARGFRSTLIVLKLSFLMPGLFLIWFFFSFVHERHVNTFFFAPILFACYARSYGKSNFPFMKIVLLPDSPSRSWYYEFFLLKFIVCCWVFFSFSLLLEFLRFWIFPINFSATPTRVLLVFFLVILHCKLHWFILSSGLLFFAFVSFGFLNIDFS